MTKIIVTGANGQLGSEIKQITKLFSDNEFIFTDIDSLDLTNKKNLTDFISKNKPDFLINCAAYTAVDKAEEDALNAEKINSKVPKLLGKLAEEFNFKIIHISTDYVYSGKQHEPIKEDSATEPASIYGKTKLKGEELLLKETKAIILRTSWLYSVFGNNFVKSMMRLGKERDQLGVVFDQIGTPTNASDLAVAILNIIENSVKNKNWESGIYNYSNEGVSSWYDFATEIMHLSKLDCLVFPILTNEYPLPAPRPSFSVMNKQKIKETFNFAIPYWKTSLATAINKLIK